MIAVQLLIGALTLVTNSFFVGGEFALISVRRSQIEPRARTGDRRARTIVWGLEHVSAILAMAQLGITVSSLVLGAVAEPAIANLLESPFHTVGVPESLIHPVSFVIALTAATYLHMLIGEMIPKNIALADPERAAYRLVPPLVAITRTLGPVAFSINSIANRILMLLNVEPKGEVNSVFTETELSLMVKDASDAELLNERHSDQLRVTLELGRRPVSTVVTPRPKIIFADPGATPATLEQLAARSGLSRFPILDNDGTVSGYLHIKDVLAHDDARHQPFPPSAIRPIARVPQDTPLDDVLAAMRQSRSHLAVTTTTDGTTTGLVTMQDILKDFVAAATP
jgi:CBS domain containing-hemolysin-like protein